MRAIERWRERNRRYRRRRKPPLLRYRDVAEVFRQTKALLLQDGWEPGSFGSLTWNGGPHCMVGALNLVTTGQWSALTRTVMDHEKNPYVILTNVMNERDGFEVADLLTKGAIHGWDYGGTGMLIAWNDADDRTLEDVLGLLDRAIDKMEQIGD